jgi:hypothetical protein
MRSEYLTAFANRELYEVDSRCPEGGGRLRVCVKLLGCVKPDGAVYGPSQIAPGDMARVEYVTGPAIGLRFEIEQRWLQPVRS